MAPTKGKGNGKRKGKCKGKGKGNSKKTKCKATSDLYLPKEIISNILSCLPVKTLLRFRCVCKKWRKLISKPNFIASHFRHSSSLQQCGSSILIHTRHAESFAHVLSMYNPPESIVELDNPFPRFLPSMSIVGPVSGIVCLFQPPWGDVVTLWNPAMRRSRRVPLLENIPLMGGGYCWVSMGLAFDYEENDLLILRIFCLGPDATDPNPVELYSTKNLRWKKLKNELVCHIVSCTSIAIIKGVPYWLAFATDEFGSHMVLVRFDVGRKVFAKLPMLGTREKTKQNFVVIENCLGMLTWEERDNSYVDVWVMDDEDGWSKKCKVGPLFGFDRIVGCLRNGDIVAENEYGVLLYDPVTSSVKAKLSVDYAIKNSYVILDYLESLVQIEGMTFVKK
ncbi:hypothetical protein CQW23_04094 [Capsicum baccatum]|uniref:F-box domain-containing protein n=1 Tax=Capsicum baccatum TaxID=33114 RepID=A0A2G2XDN9_CAPBA|nr:hypothetical protein CQW23_04094 [Capsicum baccatum]